MARIVLKTKAVIGVIMWLAPVLIWADCERLNLLLAYMQGAPGPCEIIVPGVGKQQVGANLVTAGNFVVLAVVASDLSYAGCDGSGRQVRVSVLDNATLPHLRGDINEATPWDTLSLIDIGFILPGYWGAVDTIRPYRATTHQRGVSPATTPYPKDILEYRFVVQDISANPLLGDTSSPLDSVIPNSYVRLILVLPGERHFPGDISVSPSGKKGMPSDWNAGIFYDCWVYAVDDFYNAIPFPSPPSPDSAYLIPCFTNITPDSIHLPRDRLYCEVPTPGTGEYVRKQVFKVRYPGMGYAGLKAVGIPGGDESLCEHFKITGPSPDPKDMIIVIPNPGGTPGLPMVITIKRVPIEGGQIRGKIYDSFGYLVRDFSAELQRQTEENPFAPAWVIKWDGKNDKGKRVANGCYHFCVEITQVERAGVWKEKIGVVW